MLIVLQKKVSQIVLPIPFSDTKCIIYLEHDVAHCCIFNSWINTCGCRTAYTVKAVSLKNLIPFLSTDKLVLIGNVRSASQ